MQPNAALAAARARIVTVTAFLLGLVADAWRALVQPTRAMRRDARANLSLGPYLGVAFSVIGAIVSLSLLAALAPTFFTNVGDIVSAMLSANTNSTIGDTILGIMVIVVAISLVVGFVALVLKATKFGGGKV